MTDPAPHDVLDEGRRFEANARTTAVLQSARILALSAENGRLQREIADLRAQLDARPMGGSGSGAVVLAEVPADWYISLDGYDEPSLWGTSVTEGGQSTWLLRKTRVARSLWDVFASCLPDRGDCPDCTATPCPAHAETEG